MQRRRVQIKKKRGAALLQSACGQLAVALLPVVLFLGSAIRAVGNRGGVVPAAVQTVFLGLCAAAAATALGWLAGAVRGGWRPAAWLRRWAPALLLLALALAARLPQWNTPPTDDAASYYDALCQVCREFEFSFAYWFGCFRLMAHTTWGLASLLAIPEFLLPGNYNSVWLAQTAIALITVFCVYDMLQRDARVGPRGAFWGALVFSCGAMFLGMDSYLQMDFGCACFVFWVMWAICRRQYLLMLEAALLLVTSKELGIALAAGLYLGCFMYEWRHSAGQKPVARLGCVLRKPYLGLLTAAGGCAGVALLYYLFGSALSWGGLKTGGSILGHYGVDVYYSLYKLLQCVSINFVWLLLAAAGVLLWRHRAAPTPGGSALGCITAGAVGAAVVYYLCSCLVVTFPLPRYNLPIEMLLIFACVAVFAVRLAGQARRLLCGAAALLLFAQAYLTLDPLMKLLYTQVETDGPFALCKLTAPVWGGTAGGTVDDEYLGSHVIYNYQYSYTIKAVRKILAAEDYDSDTDVVVLGTDGGLFIGALGKYGWSPSRKDFCYDFEPETLFILTTQTDWSSGHSVDKWREAGMLKGKAIFIWSPRRRATDVPVAERDAAIPAFYTNIKAGSVTVWPYGAMTYYTADYTG